MTLRNIKLALVAAAASISVFAFSPSKVDAGTLNLSAYGWAASFDDNIDLTVLSTSNDGITLKLQKFADFTGEATATGVVQPLSIVFRQLTTGAVPKIAIEEETVLNDTGSQWGGFRFIAEGGVGGHGVSFDTGASAGFSTNPFPDKEFLNNNKELRVSGGILGSGSFPNNVWQPGRASGALVINANPFSSGSLAQTFVFKEQPILIPLPAAAWTSLSGLVVVGLLAGANRARRILA